MRRIVVVALLAAAAILVSHPAQAADPPHGVEKSPVVWTEGREPDLPADARAEAGPDDRLLPSQIIEGEFDMIGLLWDEGELRHLWMQTRDQSGVWGSWTEVPVADDHGEDVPGARPGSTAIYTGDAVAVRFVAAGVVRGAEVMMIDTEALANPQAQDRSTATHPQVLQVQETSPLPEPAPWWHGADFVRDREQWDTTNCRQPDAPYFFATPKAIVVHHTAASNNYTQAEVPNIITGHCVFHVQGRGWYDLGYNFMVDRFGDVWEGRTSAKTTASSGGHTAGFNSQTQGVAMIGDFDSSPPSPTHLAGLRRILNWLTGWHSIDPRGTVTLLAGSSNRKGWAAGEPVRVPAIIGHRDLGTTTCPGEMFYAGFDSLRASLVPEDFGFDPSAITCNGLKPTIFGTPGHDRLRGTNGRDVIHGLGGSDLISGFGGDDVICGGSGNDYLIPGLDRDLVLGDSGIDTCGGDEFGSCEIVDNDEMFFYRSDGLFRYYDIRIDGTIPTPLLAGDGYTTDWDVITAVDLDGDGQDEMFFYRRDGLFRYYDVAADGSIGSPIHAGDAYTTDWSTISAVDLDGDGQDEMLFYREDGLFRYYHVNPDGTLDSPILAGDGYTVGWSSISAVDLEGDGQDEMLFYRDDGLFRYYDIRSDATLPSPMSAGSGYTTGWDSISAVDLDGDAQDEMFFYREDGLFRYYQIRSDATLPSPSFGGTGYTRGWSSITAIDIDHEPYATPPIAAH